MNEGQRQEPTARQDLIGGLLSVALGTFALVTASDYPMGTLLRMGPGLFPSVIAALIVLLGLALIAAAFRSRPSRSSGAISLRPVLMIGTGVVLFAVMLERWGLVPATLALVLVSSLAEPRWRPLRAAALAIAVTALVYVIFIVVLQIPVSALSL